jgi:tripartite-type tricarboxylate transporter receptor subunit TctC
MRHNSLAARLPRRHFLIQLGGLAAGAGLTGLPVPATAENYPSRSIRVIIPFTPGGSTDLVGRMVSEKLAERLGQTVVVENRPGAGAMIGAQAVANARPDGYTLLFTPGTIAQTPSMTPGIKFDPKRDVMPLSMCTEAPLIVVVNPRLSVGTAKELIERAKQNPGSLNVGYPGLGTTNHLALEMLKTSAGIEVTGIPYPGNAEVAMALLRGEILVAIDSVSSMDQYVKSGKVHAIATTGLKRSSILPDVPTLHESGLPGFSMTTWTGFFAPPGTPVAIRDRLREALDAIVNEPALAQRFRERGFEPVGQGSEMMVRRVASDVERTRIFVQKTGFSMR